MLKSPVPVSLFKHLFNLRKFPPRIIQKAEYATETNINSLSSFRDKISCGPNLSNFISNNNESNFSQIHPENSPPYVEERREPRKVYVETYGCQMNVNDTEIIYSIMKTSGFKIVTDILESDVIFILTCAIREGAEEKIWKRLTSLRSLKRKHDKSSIYPLKVGVLGCMAKRLKNQLLEKEKLVDIVAGPDSYKDLPNLLNLANTGQKAINVMMSADETYADIMPVRIDDKSKSAFLSIMRGCDNMCTFCIVPFTRGRERSRSLSSILDEVKYLADQGVREVTLLGQNVNSYRDLSADSHSTTTLSSGFRTVYTHKRGGMRFAYLLDKVSDVDPEMRIRFTSPHPKDFPDDVLHVINEKPNICKLLHMPAQSGNSDVLERMRRGYTREAYLELVDHIQNIIPDIAFTSDFISGFCGETEDAHQESLSLMEKVKYEFTYVFPYSMRQKTHAYYDLQDDVPEEVKKRRAEELHQIFRKCALERHMKEIGSVHLVQVIGPSKRCALDWSGRNDWNTKVIYPQVPVPVDEGSAQCEVPLPGNYIAVQVQECSSQVLKGKALYHTTLQNFYRKKLYHSSNVS